MMALPTPSRATEEEWARHKETIIARYLGDDQTQDQTLRQLDEAMRSDYGFTATSAQYTSKLKAWGARKNLALEEWETVFEILDSLPPATKSRVVISGRVVHENKISRARRYYEQQSRGVGNISALGSSSISTLAQEVHIEVQGLDGEWVLLPEMAVPSTGRIPDPSVADLSGEAPTAGNSVARNDDQAAHGNASSNISTGDGHTTIEGLVFRATPPVPHNTTINVATGPDVDLDQNMPLEQTNERIDVGFLETPNISSFHIDNSDSISLPDVSLMPPECSGINWDPSSAFDNEPVLPINSFSLDSLQSGQSLSPRLMSASIDAGMEWARHSYSSPIASSGRLVGPYSRTRVPQTGPWLPPSAAIAAMLVKDIYIDAQNSSPFRTALSAAALEDSFLFDMNPSVSIAARARISTHYSPILNHLLSIETFFGEEFTEPPNNAAVKFSAEARFYSRLITSVVNGFAGLGNIPAAGILRSLSRHPTTQVSMVRFLGSGQSPVHKSLAKNMFQAALEDDNVEVVRYLLNSNLVQANGTESHYGGFRSTALSRAASAGSFRVPRLLGSRNVVNINKPRSRFGLGYELQNLIDSIDDKSTLDDNFLSLVEEFLTAGAIISWDSIKRTLGHVDRRLAVRLIENYASDLPWNLASGDFMFPDIIKYLDKAESTRLAILIIENCRKSNREWSSLCATRTLLEAADHGYEELVGAFCDEEATDFASLINALISRNKYRLLMLDGKGVLRHLNSNQLSRAFIVALEAENLSFANRILDIGPELHFLSYLDPIRPLDEASVPVAALTAALTYNFDDIAWKALAILIMLPNCKFHLDSPIAAIIKERKRDFARAMMESSGTIFEFLSQSTWESAMKWDDDLIINDFFRRSGVSPRALKVAVDGDRMDLFWCILEPCPKGHPGWLEVGKLAIEYENSRLLDELFVRGTKPDDEELLYLALLRHPSMVKPILEQYQKAYPQGRAEYGRQAMEWIINNYPESSKFLDMFFEFGLVNEDILQGKPPGHKPLLFQAIRPEVIQYPGWFSKRLALSGAPLTLKIDQSPPRRPQPRLIRRLLDFGSNINMTMLLPYSFGATTTALLEAIVTENVEIIQLLIQSGAEVNKPVGQGIRWTPLQKAAELNNVEIVRLILENGADANAPSPKLRGATALQFATIQGNCHMLMILIQHGARLDVPPPVGPYGRWPLEGAAENGRIDMIKLLWDINNGPFDEAQCKRAIRLAERNGHMGCRDMINELMGDSLIEYGA